MTPTPAVSTSDTPHTEQGWCEVLLDYWDPDVYGVVKGPNQAFRKNGVVAILIQSRSHGDHFAFVDATDYHLVSMYRWRITKSKKGTFYARGTHPSDSHKHIEMQRLIMPGHAMVDHKDRDGLNNRRFNLRPANNAQNQWNSSGRKDRSSKYKGVCFYPKNIKARPWQVNICCNGKRVRVGYFKTEEEAARAYDDAAKQYHGEFAFLNFPEEKRD